MELTIELREEDWEILTLDERPSSAENDPNRDLNPAGSSTALETIKTTAEQHGGVAVTNRRKGSEGRGEQYGGGTSYHIIETIALSFGGSVGVAGCLHLARSMLLEWMRNKRDRSIEITVGTRKIAVRGSNDIDAALAALQGLEEPPVARQDSEPETPRAPTESS